MFSSTIVTPLVSARARLMASATYPMAVARSCFIAEPGLEKANRGESREKSAFKERESRAEKIGCNPAEAHRDVRTCSLKIVHGDPQAVASLEVVEEALEGLFALVGVRVGVINEVGAVREDWAGSENRRQDHDQARKEEKK